MENKTITEAAAILLDLLTAKLGIKEEAQPHILEILTIELETLYNKGYMQGKLEIGELLGRRHREEKMAELERILGITGWIRKYATNKNNIDVHKNIDEVLDTVEEDTRKEIDALK